MSFRLNRFGVALDAVVYIRHLSWEAPRTGMVHLSGEATPWLIKLLTRETQPAGLRTWGSLTYDGIDFRVRPPAMKISAQDELIAGSVLTKICRRMPPEQFVNANTNELARAWASNLLERLDLLDELKLDRHLQDLNALEVQRLRVVCAIASSPQVLCIVGTGWVEDAKLWSVVERAAQERLVLLTMPTWPMPDREPDAQVNLGEEGIYHDPHEPTRGIPAPSPKWMQWFEPERLAGMPRPGQEEEVAEVLARLIEQRFTHVLCLEEEHHHAHAIEEVGMIAWHFPIVDMQAPSRELALEWCERVEAAQAQGGCVAIHCKAGLGRTGTIATLLLMRRGYTLEDALMLLRGWRRHYVQTEAQLQFLRTWTTR